MINHNALSFKNKVKYYFDENYKKYSERQTIHQSFIKYIKENNINGHFLDVGCGDLSNVPIILGQTMITEYTGLDISRNFLLSNNFNVNKIQGDVEHLPFRSNTFDAVNVHMLMHHLVGRTRKESKLIVNNTIKEISRVTKNDGLIFLTDVFYDGRFIPEIASFMIFYSLRYLPSALVKHVDSDSEKGLEVCFYTSDEWKMMLGIQDVSILDVFKDHVGYNGQLARKLLIADYGDIYYILKKKLS